MNKIILTVIAVWSVAVGSVLAATPYLITWDNNPSPGSFVDPYVPGPGEILPSGVTANRLGINTIGYPTGYGISPSGYVGSLQVLDDRGSWTGNGYRFDESVAGGMTGTFTFETVFYLVATNNWQGGAHYDRALIWDNAFTGNNRGLRVTLGDDGADNYRVQYSIDHLGGGGGLISLNSGYVIQTNRWYHLGVVHDTTGARIYVDNQLIASNLSGIGGRTVIGTDNSFYIGNNLSAAYQFGGFLDSWALSDVALGPSSFVLQQPEPSTALLLALGGGILWRRRGKR